MIMQLNLGERARIGKMNLSDLIERLQALPESYLDKEVTWSHAKNSWTGYIQQVYATYDDDDNEIVELEIR